MHPPVNRTSEIEHRWVMGRKKNISRCSVLSRSHSIAFLCYLSVFMIWFLLCINRLCLQNAMLFQQHNSFSTLIVLFLSVPWHCCLGVRRGIWPVKKLWVCLLVVTIWLELCTSYSSSCHHHLLVLISNKIQNGDILVSANPGLPGKWLLKRREETWLFF